MYKAFHLYQKVLKQAWMFDTCDLVHHIYQGITREGYKGSVIHRIVRDEVQDFCQSEFLLDLRSAPVNPRWLPFATNTIMESPYVHAFRESAQNEDNLVSDYGFCRVIADPSGLFYCGDTCQTITRGVGFRFTDIKTLFYAESKKESQPGCSSASHGLPALEQLAVNYRTHSGSNAPPKTSTDLTVNSFMAMHFLHSGCCDPHVL